MTMSVRVPVELWPWWEEAVHWKLDESLRLTPRIKRLLLPSSSYLQGKRGKAVFIPNNSLLYTTNLSIKMQGIVNLLFDFICLPSFDQVTEGGGYPPAGHQRAASSPSTAVTLLRPPLTNGGPVSNE